MTLTITTRGAVHIVHPVGELDDDAADQLASVLIEHIRRGGGLIVPLTDVAHINSAGISALVNATAQANVQECRVILANPSPAVAGVLEITKLTRFFEVAPSLDDALSRVAGIGHASG